MVAKANKLVNPSVLLKDGKLLTKEIKDIGGAFTALAGRIHVAACSAVWLAAKDGRCNWLNELYAVLPKSYQDGLRVFVGPTATFNDLPLFTNNKWIKFTKDAVGNEFSVIPGTEKLRPDWIVDETTGKASFMEDGIIAAVASDFDRSFVHIGVVENAAKIKPLDEQMQQKFKGIESFINKYIDENPSARDALTPALSAVQGAAVVAKQAVFGYLHPTQAAA